MNVRKIFIAGLCLLFLAVNSLAFAEDVYVTQNGKKYHKAECRFIKDRETQKLDKQESIQQGHVPCQKCYSEDLAAEKDVKPSEKVSKSKKTKSQKDG